MWNPTSNAILEIIPSVLDHLVRAYNIYNAYEDKDNPWLVVLAATTFVIYSTTTMLKSYNEGKLMFDLDMIPLIKDEVESEITYQQKWSKIHMYYPVK